jgi:hypothetical protein
MVLRVLLAVLPAVILPLAGGTAQRLGGTVDTLARRLTCGSPSLRRVLMVVLTAAVVVRCRVTAVRGLRRVMVAEGQLRVLAEVDDRRRAATVAAGHRTAEAADHRTAEAADHRTVAEAAADMGGNTTVNVA